MSLTQTNKSLAQANKSLALTNKSLKRTKKSLKESSKSLRKSFKEFGKNALKLCPDSVEVTLFHMAIHRNCTRCGRSLCPAMKNGQMRQYLIPNSG
jgi:hypothetical protein